ncbi:hypothetical protein J3458_014336 [Metarhizium acridum]|uniref:uncharacterized protein n=1 Tax=Metarhizium acridum TaxID=92637 RepID=UPI001C6B027A|nr:hypothetical protein J3458_014336 [Metarhizium acridum]
MHEPEEDEELRRHLVGMNTGQDILDQVWQFHDGPLTGQRSYLNRYAGYAQSGHALAAVHGHLCKTGVRFRLGSGKVVEISYETPSESASGAGRIARGVKTVDGSFCPTKLVIVAMGAWASRLIPEIGSQAVAKCWSVAHVQLTDEAEEASALKGIPVTYARDLGFFFEPDPRTNLLKLRLAALEGFVQESIPGDDERKLRRLLAHTLPALAERPLVKRCLCWLADTSDSDYIIDYVPGTLSSVIVMSGDSGHGFKMFPIAGSWVTDVLKATDGKQHEAHWR